MAKPHRCDYYSALTHPALPVPHRQAARRWPAFLLAQLMSREDMTRFNRLQHYYPGVPGRGTEHYRMRISVIMTTYNAPEWLEKVLWGYSVQSHPDFEIVIGDDGSDQRTLDVINHIKAETDLDIKHVWQEDKGFRKCRILNKSILQADAPYLVFTDGDCVPRADFLSVHATEARPGHYLSGGYHKLPMSTSQAISKADILNGQCFGLKWLKAHGLKSSYKNSKLTASPGLAQVLNRLTPTACNFKGSNGSAWRKDVLHVNGFDERMPWGGLDREFGVRLINAGIRPKHVRYNAIVIHLDHPRGYRDPEKVRENKQLRLNNARNGVIRTDHGISELNQH